MSKESMKTALAGLLGTAAAMAAGSPAWAQSSRPSTGAPMVKIVVPTLQSASQNGPKPDGKGIGTATHHAHVQPDDPNNYMVYHGGPLMLGMKHIYYIWYGDWSKNNSAIQILQDLALNIGQSGYFNINTTYADGRGDAAKNSATLAGSVFDHYSAGKTLQDSDVMGVVWKAIDNGLLPEDPMGVYFVLTSADVAEASGFCWQYCGWHYFAMHNKASIKFSFVGNADACPQACSVQTTSPNGNAGADAMASVIAHELEEATTDPEVDAWYTTYGMENGDMCAWNFGSTQSNPDGSMYNMTMGRRKYLIQQNWVNAKPGFCALNYR